MFLEIVKYLNWKNEEIRNLELSSDVCLECFKNGNKLRKRRRPSEDSSKDILEDAKRRYLEEDDCRRA